MSPPTFTGIPVISDESTTPTPVMLRQYETPPSRNQSLMTIIGGVLGIIISMGGIIWVLSRAFFVTKEEYSAKLMKDVTDQATMDKKLDSLTEALRRQEIAFDKMLIQVQRLQEDLGRRK